MKQLVATGDMVLISALKHYLAENNIAFAVFDGYVSALFPGDMSITTTRVMVDEDDYDRAQLLLDELQQDVQASE